MNVKAVFHVDEMEKWDLLLTNVINLTKGIDVGGSRLTVVANAAAVKAYFAKSDTYRLRMQELVNIGVEFCACNNALNNFHLNPAEIFDFVKIVPIGTLEIIEKQQKGFAYIRP